ncbi:putative SCAR/WAVE family protein [Helianthus annuus]|nr:putative SCAR/WAVE family protein [Helianthus annuus]KAJ0876498.1 putative SCAR/WAVE family protein [Helianthus annuus]
MLFIDLSLIGQRMLFSNQKILLIDICLKCIVLQVVTYYIQTDSVESQNVSTSGPDMNRLSSTSSLPLGDDDLRNGIQSMKVQRARTPPIDAVAPYDKVKLRKVPERATPLFPKEEERHTFLEQIRAKSSNLKPTIKSRPIVIRGPMTNLRVAAILEKANVIRQVFGGSDDDEDDNDSWSDS